ncbi:hypothetical protein J3F83DRAFT_762383 [Trichoderma novae-zelandiae]
MAHQESASTDRVQKKRARTGCLRCRTRRRKCDERKSRCQRCVDAEAECVYGPRLSFLQKNAFTLSSNAGDEPLSGTPSRTPTYSKIQFVDKGAAKQQNVSRSEEPHASTASRLTRSVDAQHDPPADGGTETTPDTCTDGWQSLHLGSDASYHDPRTSMNKGRDVQAQNDALPRDHDDQQRQDLGLSHGDSYEIALDVLMNLGTGNSGVDTLAAANPTLEDDAEDNVSSLPSILKSIGDFGPVSVNVQDQLSSGRTIELLRHYRYRIAPWLDMCDTRQTFGLVMPHLATRSDMSFDALLKLSATSYAANPHDRGSNHSYPTGESHITYPIEQSRMWQVKLWSILTAVEGFLIDPPRSWDNALAKDNCLHMVCSQMAGSSSLREINEKMIWLLARLGIAATLLKETTSIVDSRLLRGLQIISGQKRDESEYNNLHYAYESLVLCSEALEFSYGDEGTSSINTEPPKPRAVGWKSIVDSLNDWYTNRPPTFRPVIDLNSEASPFPTLYFTSGAATFANQLHHTAMMLMLSHKPRTLQLDQRRSSSLSQLWHAQRICGIAVNNNRCECWDPCLLASFYLAARRMTHEAQQREILRGYKSIGALGWRVDGFVERLEGEWRT